MNNGSSGDWGYPQSDITIVDSSGQKHRIGTTGKPCSDSAGPVILSAGSHDDTVKLSYEVPSSGALNLNWAPALLGEVYQTPLQ